MGERTRIRNQVAADLYVRIMAGLLIAGASISIKERAEMAETCWEVAHDLAARMPVEGIDDGPKVPSPSTPPAP